MDSFNGVVADDFMKDSRNNSRDFRKSMHYDRLINALREGESCVVSDIRFCKRSDLEEFIGVVCSPLERVELCMVYFENNPVACKRNVRKRKRDSADGECKKIDELAHDYTVPEGVDSSPIRSNASANE